MVIGYECIRDAISVAGDLRVCDPPKSIKFQESKDITISVPSCNQIRMVSPPSTWEDPSMELNEVGCNALSRA